MDEDFGGTCFVLKPHKMPCCSAAPKLSELRYDWPVGFARCEISAMNPRMGELLDEQIRWFERVLGCPIRVIYRHL